MKMEKRKVKEEVKGEVTNLLEHALSCPNMEDYKYDELENLDYIDKESLSDVIYNQILEMGEYQLNLLNHVAVEKYIGINFKSKELDVTDIEKLSETKLKIIAYNMTDLFGVDIDVDDYKISRVPEEYYIVTNRLAVKLHEYGEPIMSYGKGHYIWGVVDKNILRKIGEKCKQWEN